MTDEFNQRYLAMCKPFIDAIKEIYATMLETELETGTPYLKTVNTSQGDYSAIMGINGHFENGNEKCNFKGSLVISWPEQTYIMSSCKMLMEDFTEYTDEIADVGLEIANMTMGNAKKVLNPKGYFIDMSTPTSIRGKGHQIGSEVTTTTIITPLKAPYGNIFVELNYKEA